MKVYFTASLKGKERLIDNYKKIVEQIQVQGYKMLSDHVLKESTEIVIAKTHEQVVDFYLKFLKLVNSSDVVIAEVSYPSTNVGHEISVALSKGKAVIVLYTKGNEPRFLTANPVDKLLVCEYDLGSLGDVLKDAFKEAKEQMDIRFTMLLSPKVVNFLNEISKKKNIPKSVFIRNLIGKEMEAKK